MSRLEYLHAKITDPREALRKISGWKMKGQKVVFTNGCFDILHQGHVTYLAKAAAMGERLVVAVNSDDSVRRLEKGPDRPVNAEVSRCIVLAALGFVDLVVLFDADTPLDMIGLLQPDVLVKGADYDPEEADPASKKYIVGSDLVKGYGGSVRAVALEEGFSTTSILSRIRS